MPDQPPSNVKIYDRPERTGPSPLMIVIGVLVVAVIGFFLYKQFYHPATKTTTQPGLLPVLVIVRQAPNRFNSLEAAPVQFVSVRSVLCKLVA